MPKNVTNLAEKRAAKSAKSLTLQFTFERSTKNTHRYNEIDGDGDVLELVDATIGTLYVKKSAIGETAPKHLTLTIETK